MVIRGADESQAQDRHGRLDASAEETLRVTRLMADALKRRDVDAVARLCSPLLVVQAPDLGVTDHGSLVTQLTKLFEMCEESRYQVGDTMVSGRTGQRHGGGRAALKQGTVRGLAGRHRTARVRGQRRAGRTRRGSTSTCRRSGRSGTRRRVCPRTACDPTSPGRASTPSPRPTRRFGWPSRQSRSSRRAAGCGLRSRHWAPLPLGLQRGLPCRCWEATRTPRLRPRLRRVRRRFRRPPPPPCRSPRHRCCRPSPRRRVLRPYP